MDQKRQTRESNIELLRIVCMILIVLSHTFLYGGVIFPNQNIATAVLYDLSGGGAKLAVVCYVLISGYFLCEARFKWERIAKIVLQVMFYAVVLALFLKVTGLTSREIQWWDLIFSPWNQSYWFATAYIMLCMFSPFLNLLIKHMSRKEHAILLGIMAIWWSILPSIFNIAVYSTELSRFIFIYFIAAYLKKYPIALLKKTWVNAVGLLLAFGIRVSFCTMVEIAKTHDEHWKAYGTFLNNSYAIPILLEAIFLFSLFKSLPFPSVPWINRLASAAFGVYLFHEHYYFRLWFWNSILQKDDFLSGEWIYGRIVVVVLGLYLTGTVIDLIRQSLLEKPLFRQWEKIKRK